MADQAAGLRRRGMSRPLRCLHAFFESPDATLRVAQALHRLGSSPLLVDATGRLFGDAPTRSLFDWRQQLARGALHTLQLPCGEGWHAPGARADEPAWANVEHRYGSLLFDEGAIGAGLALMPGAAPAVIVEVQPAQESMQRAYALLKALHQIDATAAIALTGDLDACDRVRAACAQFLDTRFARSLLHGAHEDDAIAALAVRMVAEETGPYGSRINRKHLNGR